MTAPRPPIGARVRVRGSTGIPGVAGRVGVVAGHHEDGIAVAVDLVVGDRTIVEPTDLDWNSECRSPADCDYASQGWCPRCEPILPRDGAQPCRVGRGEA